MADDDLTIEVLKGIRQELRGLRGDLGDLRGDVGHLTARVDTMGADMAEIKTDVRGMNSRFDHFLEFGGEAHRGLEHRVDWLEQRVFGARRRT